MRINNIDTAIQIKERIRKIDASATVILFGSRARGEERDESDWDVLILTDKNINSKLDEREYRNQLFDLELEIGQPISIVIVMRNYWEEKYLFSSFYKNVINEGVYL